jgi:sigma-B regulation protein RsbU (phosphoserine phosphatase)
MWMLFSLMLADTPNSSVPLADVRSQTPMILVGFILLAVGVAAMTLFFARRQSRDLTLIYFSIFSVLYAVRLLWHVPVIHSLADVSGPFVEHLDLWITVTILIPFLLFLRQVLEPQTKTLLNPSLIAAVIFAVVSIAADLFGMRMGLAYSLNNYLVLAIVGSLMVNFVVQRSRGLGQPWVGEYRVLTIGLVVFGAFVIEENVASVGSARGGPGAEAFGFLFFVGCLGYVAAHRTFANEHRLLAIDKELEIAQQIQSSILPREVPRIAGLEIAARYLPMSAVAGDFYDFFALEKNRLGVLIADVTGHGVPAAIIASMLKVAFAGQKAHAQHPELVLAGLNQALCGKFADHFVTAAYLYADLDAKIVRYAGAGHPPLLRGSRLNRDASSVEQNGIVLGMFPEVVYTSLEIPLQPGDRYVLYTDGLTESANTKAEEFGLSRCEHFLAAHSQLPAAALADQLLSEIARWSDRSSARLQADDITLVVIDWQGQPEAADRIEQLSASL